LREQRNQRFSQTRETYRASGRSDTEGQVLTELAGVHRRLGREAEALDTLRQAVEALRDGGNRPGQAVALRELGDTLCQMGDAAQARSAWAAAHELLVAIASPDAAEIRARIAALDA
jgi:tetratricopeptide (TPR) repeat protein